ncbi:MAG: hypothetical protein QOD66_1462 [Solirubrobacteraceae bacterium]|jgi:MFS family permease|nr:hypothetical protein [Solirubrobacteraceae bacterium]
MGAIRSRLPRGQLRHLLAAWLLVGTGAWAFSVALGVYAFRTSGVGALGLVMAARLLPATFAAPLAGRLVDRGDRARLVAISCVLEALFLGVAAGLVLTRASLAIIAVFAAAVGAVGTAPRPALQALMPALAKTPDELTGATAAWSAIDNIGFLLGSGAAGAAIVAVGSGAVAALAAVLLLLAGLLASTLPPVIATPPDQSGDDADGLAGALAGLRAVIHSPALRTPYALFASLLLLEGTTDVQLVALSLGKLHMGNSGPGVLYAVWGVGGILGSTLILTLVRRRGYGLALAIGALVFGCALAATGADGIPLAVVAMVPAGLGFGLVEASVMGLVPRLADDAVMGRVYGLSEILYAGAAGVGAVIAPLLTHIFGAAGTLAVVGLAFAAGAGLAWPACSRLDSGQGQTTRVRELLRGIPFLAPLPLPRLERLVRAARAVSAPAGTTIIRLGDRGDDFYVIDEGTVEIVGHGRREGHGEGFGEIALLRDSPRTATVCAATDVRLWAVGRTPFIAAVSGHGDARRLADAVVTERLAHPDATLPAAD